MFGMGQRATTGNSKVKALESVINSERERGKRGVRSYANQTAYYIPPMHPGQEIKPGSPDPKVKLPPKYPQEPVSPQYQNTQTASRNSRRRVV